MTDAELSHSPLASSPLALSPLAEVSMHREGQGPCLVFSRDFQSPIEELWSMLTSIDGIAKWAPFDADREMTSLGPITLFIAPDRQASTGEILRADAPHQLDYKWGEDLLRWTLQPIFGGTNLTLHHSGKDSEWEAWIPNFAAGWHICFDVMALALKGKAVPRIVGKAARSHGADELKNQYAERLKMEAAPWPEI